VGFILYAGWQVLRESIRVLLDASLDFATLDQAQRTILAEPKVQQLKSLTGRNSGRFKFLEAEVVLRVADLERAHHLATRLEERLKQAIPNVDRVTLHVEPPAKTTVRYAVPLEADGRVSRHFGEAPRFALLDVRAADRQLLHRKEWANPFRGNERGKGIRVAEFLVASDVDVVVLREDLHGKGPEYVFSDAGIDVSRTDQEDWTALLDELNIVAGDGGNPAAATEGGENHDTHAKVSVCSLRA
jgi:predicted Fe-Mo cluster-binding NifX family protein